MANTLEYQSRYHNIDPLLLGFSDETFNRGSVFVWPNCWWDVQQNLGTYLYPYSVEPILSGYLVDKNKLRMPTGCLSFVKMVELLGDVPFTLSNSACRICPKAHIFLAASQNTYVVWWIQMGTVSLLLVHLVVQN